MPIEKNDYIKVLENKVAYDQTFKMVESNNRYARFFNQNNIQVNGRAIEYFLS